MWLAIGLYIASLVGMVVWIVSDATWLEGFGWAAIAEGAALLFAAGMEGGGLVTAGDYGVFYGRRHTAGWDNAGDIQRAQDLRDRMRQRLRPKENPNAFWQVIGGLVLVLAGLAALSAVS